MRPVLALLVSLTAVPALTGPVAAADLPGPFVAAPPPVALGYAPRPPYGRPYFAEAARFDIYGYPILPAVPNPLYASTGCPANLQPIYDAAGNFAGYGPAQACR